MTDVAFIAALLEGSMGQLLADLAALSGGSAGHNVAVRAHLVGLIVADAVVELHEALGLRESLATVEGTEEEFNNRLVKQGREHMARMQEAYAEHMTQVASA